MHKLERVIYASSVMREEDFFELFKDSSKIPGQQAQKFNRLMVKGFAKNGLDIKVISAPPITPSNCPSKVKALGRKKNGNVCYRYLPIVNIRGIKNIFVMITSFFSTFFSLVGKNAAVVCDVLNISVAMGAVTAGRLLRKRCAGIVTDIPELMVTGHTDKMIKLSHRIIGKCTDYVFLTEAMNERLNPEGKPYVIVEGVCDEDQVNEYISADGADKSCLYAGLLDAEYGVKSMVDAFIMADIPNCTLHLCGGGPYVAELNEIVKKHENVVYHGMMMISDVLDLERKVSLLINPRPSSGEFTKFSFPSKNMEYMTSGTPVIANRLLGIPNEYYDYIYVFGGETVEEMAESFRTVFFESPEALSQKGADAYRFVTEFKNSKAQAGKVIKLIHK